ncbi:MAG: lamin tail domain-containing protein [Myxococcota bacterium]
MSARFTISRLLLCAGLLASAGCGDDKGKPDAGDAAGDVAGDSEVQLSDTEVGDGSTPEVDAAGDADSAADLEIAPELPPPSPDWPAAGELVITEVMKQPAAVGSAQGEWFEITNLLARNFDLKGCYLGSAGDAVHLIETSVSIGPGEVRVLGRNADAGTNGGVAVNYDYGDLDLADGADGISIRCGDELVDAVEWDSGATYPQGAGVAMQLDPGSYDAGKNNFGASWCAATNVYGAGDRGTPGAGNPPCDAGSGVARCRLVGPIGVETLTGTPLTLQGRLRQPGLTDQTPINDIVPTMRGEVAWGPDGTNPAVDDSEWQTVEAAPDPEWVDGIDPGADQWLGTFTTPPPGEWDYAFRFTINDGASWTWCDLATGAPGEDGSQNGYQPANAGALTTVPNACAPNPCIKPPAASCDGTVLTAFVTLGGCSIVGSAGVCDYPPTVVDCADFGTTCEGTTCAGLPGPPTAGQVIITEVLQDPDASFDDFGEWFELTNIGDDPVNLAGCAFESTGDPGFAMDPGTPVIMTVGEAIVFGASAKTTINGGVDVDVEWTGLRLGNNNDVLTLRCEGALIDSIAWDNGATFPDDKGAAMQLAPEAYDAAANDSGAAWCSAVVPFGDGDKGTPGATNPVCPDACDGVPCASPPPSDCLGSVARIYEALGTCSVGACTYAPASSVDCAETGKGCKLGACVDIATTGKTPAPGELVINEILKNSSAVGDSVGEWFEVANLTGVPLDLAGCVLSSSNDLPHTIPKSPAVAVAAGGYLVLAISGNKAVNGGVTADYVYTNLTLGNGSDSLSIRCDNVLVDTVAWDEGATFPDPDGASLQLDPSKQDPALNDVGGNWCAATSAFGAGDKGTPGQPNTSCGDSCAGVVCSTQPPAICDGTVATSYEAAGTCAGGKCSYAVAMTEDCPASEQECVSGMCVEPGSVLPMAGVGQLVITEIMQNPEAAGDPEGEWFEVTSLVSFAVDLEGCLVRSKSDSDEVIKSGGPLVLPANGRIVLGFSDDPLDNGGVDVAHAYGSIALGNGADSIAIVCGGVVLDVVAWDGGTKFPDPSGASMQLDPAAFEAKANDAGAAWCVSTATYGDGDKGTPGELNSACQAP